MRCPKALRARKAFQTGGVRNCTCVTSALLPAVWAGSESEKSMQQTYLAATARDRSKPNDFVRSRLTQLRTRWPTRWLPAHILADFRGLTC